jgi:hypothetical protein
MQADRRPFFYYFPLMISRPMKGRSFSMTSLFTNEQMAKTLGHLEREKPEYVFMERIFMTSNYPVFFRDEYPGLIPLLKYVLTNYSLSEEGYYLVALKRKTDEESGPKSGK